MKISTQAGRFYIFLGGLLISSVLFIVALHGEKKFYFGGAPFTFYETKWQQGAGKIFCILNIGPALLHMSINSFLGATLSWILFWVGCIFWWWFVIPSLIIFLKGKLSRLG